MKKQKTVDSVLGCIMGGAIGDCVAGVPERKNLSLSDDTQLIQAGGDSDTIGSLAGQIAGAHLGYSRLPRNLLALEPVQAALPIGESFARMATVGTEGPGTKS